MLYNYPSVTFGASSPDKGSFVGDDAHIVPFSRATNGRPYDTSSTANAVPLPLKGKAFSKGDSPPCCAYKKRTRRETCPLLGLII